MHFYFYANSWPSLLYANLYVVSIISAAYPGKMFYHAHSQCYRKGGKRGEFPHLFSWFSIKCWAAVAAMMGKTIKDPGTGAKSS